MIAIVVLLFDAFESFTWVSLADCDFFGDPYCWLSRCSPNRKKRWRVATAVA